MNTLSLQGHRELLTGLADVNMPDQQITNHQEDLLKIHEYALENKIGRQITEADRLLRHIEFELFMRNGGDPREYVPGNSDHDFSMAELESLADQK